MIFRSKKTIFSSPEKKIMIRHNDITNGQKFELYLKYQIHVGIRLLFCQLMSKAMFLCDIAKKVFKWLRLLIQRKLNQGYASVITCVYLIANL